MRVWFNRFLKFDWFRLFPWAVVLGVLSASVLLGIRATPRYVLLAAAVVGGVIAFVWLTRHIEWGVLVLVPISFLVSWGMGTGTNTDINLTILLVILLLGVWVLRMLVIERRVGMVGSRVNLPALLFIIGVGLSVLAGNLPWLLFVTQRASNFAQIGGVLMLVLPVGLMLLVGNVLRQEHWLHWLVWLFLGLGALYMASRLLLGEGGISGIYNLSAVRALFFVWSAALSGGMLLFNNELKGWQQGGMGLILGLTLAVGLSLTRNNASNWAPALVTIGMLVVLKWWRIGLLVGVSGGALVLVRYQQIYQRLFGSELYSVITRAATWPIMLELVKTSPLLGLGPSNYYFYTSKFSLMGYFVQFNSHNNYWDLAAQVGLVGLGFFLWMVIALGWTSWKLRKRVTTGFQRGYVNGALAGLVGTLAAGMLADWFMPFVYNIGFDGFRGAAFAWLFLGGLIVLERKCLISPSSS